MLGAADHPTNRKGIWGSHRGAGGLPRGEPGKGNTRRAQERWQHEVRLQQQPLPHANISQAYCLPRIPPGKALIKQVRLFPRRGIRANQWKDAFPAPLRLPAQAGAGTGSFDCNPLWGSEGRAAVALISVLISVLKHHPWPEELLP